MISGIAWVSELIEVAGGVDIRHIPAMHSTILDEPAIGGLSEKLRECLDRDPAPAKSWRTASWYCRSRVDWKYPFGAPLSSGPSSQSMPSHLSPCRIGARALSTLRPASVSSMRRINCPPCFRANNQLKSAVRTPPMCK